MPPLVRHKSDLVETEMVGAPVSSAVHEVCLDKPHLPFSQDGCGALAQV